MKRVATSWFLFSILGITISVLVKGGPALGLLIGMAFGGLGIILGIEWDYRHESRERFRQ